ncbi:MAG: hypothetical protein KA765_05830 [Thermoflexales bacterium]|nr:hypothetical protein [Thermoflexales bacterium]
MNIQLDAQPAVQPPTDVDDTFNASAGYFVRTDLRAGSCSCDTQGNLVGAGCSPNKQSLCPECSR